MNNEPVAWMDANDKTIISNEKKWANDIPLYTHPHPDNLGLALSIIDQQKLEIERLKAKTLTDEEILDICIMGGFYDRIDDPFFDKKTGAWSLDEDLIQFARAILRKAQE